MTPPPFFARYRRQRPLPGTWQLEGGDKGYTGAIVIPALAESESLFLTLDALAATPPVTGERFLAVIVVNARADAPDAEQYDNQRTLQRLHNAPPLRPDLDLTWVDATSVGKELPPNAGVGLARKIGFDLALERLAGPQSLLISLDADTLVEASYLRALTDHFAASTSGGAVLPFRHQHAATPDLQEAVDRYELYLHGYRLGLELAGSPYAFHTIGSAFACRASAYCAAGGMNRRHAGEDFYFLQQLARTSGVAQLVGTTVHPSPRISHRTPFGTGQSVAAYAAGRNDITLYPIEAFLLLRQTLQLLASGHNRTAQMILEDAAQIVESLATFLEQQKLRAIWPKLQQTHRESQRFQHAVSTWFDGLKSLRLLRFASDPFGGTLPVDEAIPPLLAAAGLTSEGGPSDWLERLRC
ncbi:MAG: hypothetical protein C0621_09150 [Desulfuromonas sp.]|nr:MAG: hypothetical protein C0621_09150 [Desulfuromonas sp.]